MNVLASLLLTSFVGAAPPNVVVFIVDDLGWADLSCYGSTYHRTPHIDALASAGVRFTDAYASCPVCSPTRAALMTGRHPVRVNVTDWIPGVDAARVAGAKFAHVHDRDDLALDEVTVAEALRQADYQTWFAGKWHLGGEGHWPTDQGFDANVGGCEAGSPPGGYYAPWKNPNLQANASGEYLTERLTEESIGLMERRDAERPFLLWLCYYNVHTPVTAYEKRVNEYESPTNDTPSRAEHDGQTRLRQDNPAYASMVAAVDDSVGRITATLSDLGLSDNTLIVFTSDNGGLSTKAPHRKRRLAPTSNLPLRAGKGWLYEGGTRIPQIVAGPGVARGRTVSQVTASTDIVPTIMEACGLEMPTAVDGSSLWPVLGEAEPEPFDRPVFWHYPHYHGSTWAPGAALRDGRWKLIDQWHYDEVSLFDLSSDISEANDLSEAMPEKRDELLARLRAWQSRMGAAMPERVAAP